MGSNLTEVSTYSANVVGPDAGNPVTAASVRVMGTALANRTHALVDGKWATKSGVTSTVQSGGNLQLDAGAALVSNGSAEFNGTGPDKTTVEEASIVDVTVTGKATLNGTGADVTVIAEADAATVSVDDLTIVTTCSVESPALLTVKSGAALTMGATSLLSTQGRIRHRVCATMTDADQTLDVATADQWQMDANPGAKRTIKLKTSNATNDETISLIVRNMVTAGTSGDRYEIQREDGTPLANLHLIIGFAATVWARFRFVGSTWELDENCGRMWNDATSAYYGCVPA